MVQDIVTSQGVDLDKAEHREKEIFIKITNLLSDRASTEKKFNSILSQYRSKILPDIVDGFTEYSETEQAKLSLVNELFCGLHLIDGLAHQANVTLSVWEGMIFGKDKVGSQSLPGIHKDKGESGTVRLIRTVCKAVQERGCEKFGKPVQFRTFLVSKNKSDRLPLSTFKGNRINIVFHNAAGVYFLYSDLLEFTSELQQENKLIAEVFADLSVRQFLAGCRALGLISKCITEPLWRILSKKEHVLKMNERYQTLISKMREWTNDGSKLVSGKACLFEDVEMHCGPVFEKLIEKSSADFDELTVQAVELILASLVKVCCRMLADHLEHGRYDQMSEELLQKLESVPKTNVSCERDFGVFDNLLRAKTRATGIALEGMVMFKENRSWKWLADLDSQKKSEVLAVARMSVRNQRAVFCNRMKSVREARLQRMKDKMDNNNEKEQKEITDMAIKKKLTVDLEQYGGLWETAMKVDEQIEQLDEDLKSAAVIAQLKFRRFVLGMKNENGVLNTTKRGTKLSVDELVQNLKSTFPKTTKVPEKVKNVMNYSSAPSELLAQEKNRLLQEAMKQQVKVRDEGRKKIGLKELGTPELTRPEHLLGKRVRHAIHESEGKAWYNGTVVGMREENGAPTFQMMYDGCQLVWWFDLWKDFQENCLELISVNAEDILGKKVEHMFISSEDGAECWWPGKVLQYKDSENLFVIEYEEEEDDAEGAGVFEYPLLDDYAANELRILS
ncbi:hypothetical protein AOXY_G15031 [Acipenser oxyrinchus oxyrinchus]|uniref:Uncharacterized protein n=1 Tax=Acipenser oxyrinchus oxyrinchus TaxID=40147 RepID=A0AAD8DB73_ACIOX|nr:hypothetical protein AOXY_G15031 [Acipenser oxyrinchus oxyrinchus]